MRFLRKFLSDVATLKLPVTAAAVVATVVAVADPFGFHVPEAALTGALVAVGTIAAYIDHLVAGD